MVKRVAGILAGCGLAVLSVAAPGCAPTAAEPSPAARQIAASLDGRPDAWRYESISDAFGSADTPLCVNADGTVEHTGFRGSGFGHAPVAAVAGRADRACVAAAHARAKARLDAARVAATAGPGEKK